MLTNMKHQIFIRDIQNQMSSNSKQVREHIVIFVTKPFTTEEKSHERQPNNYNGRKCSDCYSFV